MCKGCWQNFKRRSDRTLDYWAWECYPRGLLPGEGGDDDGEDVDDDGYEEEEIDEADNANAAAAAPSSGTTAADDDEDEKEVVIVRLARLWPTAIWGELGGR